MRNYTSENWRGISWNQADLGSKLPWFPFTFCASSCCRGPMGPPMRHQAGFCSLRSSHLHWYVRTTIWSCVVEKLKNMCHRCCPSLLQKDLLQNGVKKELWQLVKKRRGNSCTLEPPNIQWFQGDTFYLFNIYVYFCKIKGTACKQFQQQTLRVWSYRPVSSIHITSGTLG